MRQTFEKTYESQFGIEHVRYSAIQVSYLTISDQPEATFQYNLYLQKINESICFKALTVKTRIETANILSVLIIWLRFEDVELSIYICKITP